MNKPMTRRGTYSLGRRTRRTMDLVWISKDGRHTPICEMSDRHLQNVWRLIRYEKRTPKSELIAAEMRSRSLHY